MSATGIPTSPALLDARRPRLWVATSVSSAPSSSPTELLRLSAKRRAPFVARLLLGMAQLRVLAAPASIWPDRRFSRRAGDSLGTAMARARRQCNDCRGLALCRRCARLEPHLAGG